MKNLNYKNLIQIILSILPGIIFAQSPVEMADNFRADGKIYVVVAVVAVILFGIFFYLFRTEKKVDDLAKKLNK